MSDRDELTDRVSDIDSDVQDFINEAQRDLPTWLFQRNEDDLRDVRRLLGVIYESLLTDQPIAGDDP